MLRTKRWNAIECSINTVLSVLVHSVAWSNCSHRRMHSPFLYFSDSTLFLKTCLPFPVFIQNKRTTDLEFRLQTFHFWEENLKAQQGLSQDHRGVDEDCFAWWGAPLYHTLECWGKGFPRPQWQLGFSQYGLPLISPAPSVSPSQPDQSHWQKVSLKDKTRSPPVLV